MDKISDETVQAFLEWLSSRTRRDSNVSPGFRQHPELVGRTKELTAFAAGVKWSDEQKRLMPSTETEPTCPYCDEAINPFACADAHVAAKKNRCSPVLKCPECEAKLIVEQEITWKLRE